MSAIATPVVEKWIAATLKGDATLVALATGGIYADIAPSTATYPLVLYNIMSSTIRLVTGGSKLWEEILAEVKGIDKLQNYAALVAIANRIDTLLHLAPPQAISGGTLQDCVSDGGVKRVDPPSNAISYAQLGSRYRIHCQAP